RPAAWDATGDPCALAGGRSRERRDAAAGGGRLRSRRRPLGGLRRSGRAEGEVDGEVVLVLGAEREGLPSEVLERCDARASIPQPGGGNSLNVAIAGS